MRVRTMAALFAIMFAAVSAVFAQETTGAVRGRIQDAQGLSIPGVTVTVTGPQGSQTAVTDADGRFNFPFLTPGTYSVRAEFAGCRRAEVTRDELLLNATRRDNIHLETGITEQSVTVQAMAPVVNSETASIASV